MCFKYIFTSFREISHFLERRLQMFWTCTCNVFYLGILLIICPLEYDTTTVLHSSTLFMRKIMTSVIETEEGVRIGS